LLAVIFLLMSVDEIASIHELTIRPLRTYLDANGAFLFTWVIPGTLFVILIFVRMLRLLRALDTRTRYRFLSAGAVYVGGALGMEMVSGAYVSAGGDDAVFAVLTIIEELLEMLGILLFLHALVSYMTASVPNVILRFEN
jgi:hypothetical protein